MDGVSPVSVIECEVLSDNDVEAAPYADVAPYATRESATSSVVQVMVAVVSEVDVATEEIEGAVTSIPEEAVSKL